MRSLESFSAPRQTASQFAGLANYSVHYGAGGAGVIGLLNDLK